MAVVALVCLSGTHLPGGSVAGPGPARPSSPATSLPNPAVRAPTTSTHPAARSATARPSAEIPDWTNITPSAGRSPPPRISGGMVYDAKDGYNLLFGGEYDNTSTFSFDYYNDTWAFANGTWKDLDISVAPSPRFAFGLAYDAKDGYVVLFGGRTATDTALNDTWTYSGGVWTNITTSQAPASRFWPSMTFDTPDQFVLLFGGYSTGIIDLNDTWKFVAGSWTQLFVVTHPSARHGAAMTSFTPVENIVLLFGGLNSASYLNDTWSFVDGAWILLNPSTPPDERVGAGLVVDPVQRVAVLYGGYPADSYPYGTWTFSSNTWTEYPLTSTPIWGTVWGQMCYDPTDHWVLLYESSIPATWVLNFTNGTSPPPPLEVTASVDPLTGPAPLSVTFNSTATGGTLPYHYSWTTGDGVSFTTRNASFLYASDGTYTVHLWVNDSATGTFVDTWTVVVGGGNFQASGGPAPDPVDVGQTVWFNSTASGGIRPYTFSWHFGDGGSASVENTTHSYSSSGQYPVSFRGEDSAGHSIWLNTTETVNPALAVVASVAPLTGTTPLPVSFTSSASGGTAPYSFHWDFGHDSGTGSSENASYSYAIAGTYTVNLTVTDAVGAQVARTWTIDASAPPPITVTVSASTLTPSVGEVVSFNSTPSGGVPPYTYAWTLGGQAGAAARNTTHAFPSVGIYVVLLTLRDTTGASAIAQLSVTVSASAATTANSSSVGLWEIGIGVVLVLAAILILLAIGRRRRKKPAEAGAPTPPAGVPPS